MRRRELLRFGVGCAVIAPAWGSSSPSLKGTVRIVGSDSLSSALAAWGANYRRQQPQVDVEIQSTGSATGAIALIQGTADLSPMSRALDALEMAAFERRFGYRPGCVSVALDALGVVTAVANPLQRISLLELDQVFSSTRKCSFLPRIERFSELADGHGLYLRIRPLGRSASSGSYGYFRQSVLCNGRFSEHYRALPGAAAVAYAVARSTSALGYVGAGFLSSQIKAISVSAGPIAAAVAPNEANILSGRYPLSRELKVYFNRAPAQALKPEVQAFLSFALSDQGQLIARQGGLVPLPRAALLKMRATIGA